MKTKVCITCLKTKSLDDYRNQKVNKDGKRGDCRICEGKARKRQKRSKFGLVAVMYCSQRHGAKAKNYPEPSHTLPEFREWMNGSEKYDRLYDEWERSGYDRDKRPSIDRIDDYKTYSLDNIQVTTWEENRNRYYSDKVNGINNKASESISQYSLDGVFIQEFHSHAEASRDTGVIRTNISKCYRGERNHAGGFIWKPTQKPAYNNS